MAASNLEPAVWSSPNGVLSEMPCRFAVVERAVANAVITDAAVKQSARPPDPGSPQLATSTRAYSTGLSTGHLPFVRSMRQRLPHLTPAQQPGTFGRGPPPQSGHRRQSISSLRSLQFAAWSSAAPLAGGPGRLASSLLRLRRRQPSVSGARSALAPCSTRDPS
jgi:hypothetical protein